MARIIKALEDGKPQSPYFLDQDQVLFRKEAVITDPCRNESLEQLVIPASMVYLLLRAYHDAPYSAHQGPQETWRKLKRTF